MPRKKLIEPQGNEAIIETFTDYLSTHNKRKTPERYRILDKVLSFSKMFTIENLKDAMNDDESFPVSQSTLYYTVDLLVDANILRRINTGTQALAFERTENVKCIHLKCEVCGKTKLVKDTNFMAYMNARRFAAFTTSYYNLTVYGTCNDCARRLKREQREKTTNISKNQEKNKQTK